MKKILHALLYVFIPLIELLSGQGVAIAAGADYDPTFGSGTPGRITLSAPSAFPSGTINHTSIGEQSDGKILLAGYFQETVGDLKSALIIRLQSSGSPDPSFGVDGFLKSDFGIGATELRGFKLLQGGGIIVAGHANVAGVQQIFVARLNASGQLDSAFGNGGTVFVPGLAGESLAQIAIQSTGKIILVGTKQASGERSSFVARLTAGGQLDTSFACQATCSGVRIFTSPSGFDFNTAAAVTVLNDDRVLIAGITGTDSDQQKRPLLRRLLPDAGDDSTFSQVVSQAPFSISFLIGNIGIQPDGKVLLATVANYGVPFDFIQVVRYLPNGTLDTDFNSGAGFRSLTVGQYHKSAFVSLKSTGEIFLAGTVQGNPYSNPFPPFPFSAFVARFNQAGEFDALTPVGGRSYYPQLPDEGKVEAFMLDSSERAVFAGGSRVFRLIAVGAEVVPNPANVAFPLIAANSSATRLVSVGNPGSLPVSISAVSIAGNGFPFTIEGNNCVTVIPAGGSCNFTVRFSPVSVGTFSTSILLSGNFERGELPLSVPLSGSSHEIDPPVTSITSAPAGTIGAVSASFAFSSTEPGTFECSLDRGPFFVCTSPTVWDELSLGSHVFAVRAIDSYGNTDPTPAEASFIVVDSGSTTRFWFKSLPTVNGATQASRLFQPPTESFSVSTQSAGVQVLMDTASGTFLFYARDPNGARLQPGVYELASNPPLTNAYATFRFEDPATTFTCRQVTGEPRARFTVLEANYNPDDSIQRLALDFEFRCGDPSGPIVGELRINSNIPFSFQEAPGSSLPNPFAFFPMPNAGPAKLVESNLVTIAGINTSSPISIAGGEYSINGGDWKSVSGVVKNRDTLRLRANSDSSYGGIRTATVNVGGFAADFVVTTYVPVAAQVPASLQTGFWYEGRSHPFAGSSTTLLQAPYESVSAVTGGPLGAYFRTNSLSPATQWELVFAPVGGSNLTLGAFENAISSPNFGTSPQLDAHIFGLGCSTRNGRFVILEAEFGPNNTVLRFAVNFEHWCVPSGGPMYGELRYNSTVPFTFQKQAGATVPDPFSFKALINVSAAQLYESNEVGIYGINAPTSISISGGEYSVNGGTWLTSAGSVVSGDRVKVRTTSSSLPGAMQEAVLTVGNVSSSFPLITFQSGLLTLQRAGAGSGLVTSNPSGINCGPDCSETMAVGTTVTLTALADPGSTFTAWSGVTCAGPNTATTCSFNLVANATVTATFALVSGVAISPFDLSGDGKGDIVWRNGTTGENYFYPMDGRTILSSEGAFRSVPAPWVVAGVGDFDGDDKADLLWRNTASGENYIYFMDGKLIKVTEGFIRSVPTNWVVGGVGDFDGDGKADILWRNTSTGENYLYFMDGRTIKATEGYTRSVATAWIPAAVADFDGDGKADILWRNTSTGESYLYPMDGKLIKATEGYIRGVATNWIVAGSGDFTGDGKADILWRNTSTGENYLYPMDGRTILATEGFIRSVPTNWIAASVTDYDGDGKVDILWRNTSTGENYIYPMDGRTIKATEGFIRSVPTAWNAVTK